MPTSAPPLLFSTSQGIPTLLPLPIKVVKFAANYWIIHPNPHLPFTTQILKISALKEVMDSNRNLTSSTVCSHHPPNPIIYLMSMKGPNMHHGTPMVIRSALEYL
jgi:hypothetical protein